MPPASLASPPDPPQGINSYTQDLSSRQFPAALVSAIVLLLALAWRLMGILRTEAWRDEAITIIHTQASWRDLLVSLPMTEDTPPLGFLVFKLWSSLFQSEPGFRLLSVVLGVVTVGVVMRLARRIEPGSMWAAGLMAAFSCAVIHYSQEIRAYSLLMLCTASCLLAAERFVAGGGGLRWSVGLALAAGIAAHCHASGLFVYPMGVAYVLARSGEKGAHWRALVVGAVLWVAMSVPIVWFSMHWSRLHAREGTWWVGPLNWALLRGLLERFLGIANVGAWSASRTWYGDMWTGFAIERLLMVGPVLLIGRALLDHRLRGPAAALLAASGVHLGSMLLSSVVALPNIAERTVLPAWIPLLVLLGLSAGGGAWRRGACSAVVGAIALTWALNWAWIVYAGPIRRPISRDAMRWMARSVRPDDVIVSGAIGYEDIVVYHLGGLIAGEQLFSEGVPVYTGKPPRHLFVYRSHDPHWADRLGEALRVAASRGGSHSVWMVRYGMPHSPDPGLPEGVIGADHEVVDRYVAEEALSTSVVRYAPKRAGSARAITSCPQ